MNMAETKTNVYKKILNVMTAVERVEKKGHNDFQNYDYATEADVLAALRGELIKQQLIVIPQTTDYARNGEVETVGIDFHIIDAETGESVTSRIYGSGYDKTDKGVYKAYTGAMKYFLMKTFMIATNDDPEKEDKRPVGRPAKVQSRPEETIAEELDRKTRTPYTADDFAQEVNETPAQREMRESIDPSDAEAPREGARLLTVKKEGKNQGRKFWSDPNDPDFFQWAD